MIKILRIKNKEDKIIFFTRVFIVIFFLTVFLFSKFAIFIKWLHFPDFYPFLDLKGRLAHLQAHRAGIDTYLVANPFDPINRSNNKPSISLIFAFTGLGVKDANWLGYFLVTGFIFQSISLLRKSNIIALILGAFCVFSPNTLFAVERCNDDLIIFLFCFGIPYLISKNHIFDSFSILIIWFLSALKYYPLILYSLYFKNFTRKFKHNVFYILLPNVIWINLFWKEILFIKPKLPKHEPNIFSFNIQDLSNILTSKSFLFNDQISNVFNILIILFFFLVTTYIYIYLKKESKVLNDKLSSIDDIDKRYFIIGSSMLTFCYLLFFNWSYRLILSIFLLPTCLNLLKKTRLNKPRFNHEKISILIISSLFISNWINMKYYFFTYLIKIIFNFLFFSSSTALGLFILINLNFHSPISDSKGLNFNMKLKNK